MESYLGEVRGVSFAVTISALLLRDALPTVAQEDPEGLRRTKVGGGGGSRTLKTPMITNA